MRALALLLGCVLLAAAHAGAMEAPTVALPGPGDLAPVPAPAPDLGEALPAPPAVAVEAGADLPAAADATVGLQASATGVLLEIAPRLDPLLADLLAPLGLPAAARVEVEVPMASPPFHPAAPAPATVRAPAPGSAWTPPGGDPLSAMLAAASAAEAMRLAAEAGETAEEGPLPPVGALPPPPGPEAGFATNFVVGTTLLLLLLASLYSRFQRHTLLLSPARAALHAAIVRAPGSTIGDLSAATGLRRGAIVHHAQMLEKHGLVASRHDGLHRRFHPPGGAAPEPRPPTPKERRILVALEESGPLTQAELAQRLGVSRQAVHQQVKRLARDRRIVPEEAGDETRWRPPATPAPPMPPAP